MKHLYKDFKRSKFVYLKGPEGRTDILNNEGPKPSSQDSEKKGLTLLEDAIKGTNFKEDRELISRRNVDKKREKLEGGQRVLESFKNIVKDVVFGPKKPPLSQKDIEDLVEGQSPAEGEK